MEIVLLTKICEYQSVRFHSLQASFICERSSAEHSLEIRSFSPEWRPLPQTKMLLINLQIIFSIKQIIILSVNYRIVKNLLTHNPKPKNIKIRKF